MFKIHKPHIKLTLFILLLIFCYFRLKPIYLQTVGYTYDQGRDFLKAAEIILYKNPTFLGPTTGIMGINHGVWWYYFLIFPFTIFNGNPQGFYFFMFLSQLATIAVFYWFVSKKFGAINSLLFCLLITISPYFITASVFAGHNYLTIPMLLLLTITCFHILHQRQKLTRKQLIAALF